MELLEDHPKNFVSVIATEASNPPLESAKSDVASAPYSGFYPMLAVYNQMKVELYEKVIEIEARGGVIQGAKADAVYEKGRGNEMDL